ncbi:ATP-binding protein [Paenibacillus sp. URB8-2]|uniref:ATP-binding protein n=1 Tax=Paenibacillus sp. URB8-2 TaxID=2741301 RepID=UPI0015B8FCDC|nr:ATP-binding protein [Paenibacillus sp. URB8-2]BCG59085.1 ATPase [Paenibacillus sp. URB8-2]
MDILMKDHPFGQIVSITGMSVTIEIYQDILANNLEQEKVLEAGKNIKLNVGTVGDIFLVGGPSTHNIMHFGIFEEIKLVSSFEQDPYGLHRSTEPKNKAIAVAKVIGYQDLKVKNELKFMRGAGHYPKFNAKCHLLSPEEKKQLFALNEGAGITIGKASGVQEEDISIHIDKFLGKHSVILGSTGSGKSCTVASIMQNVLKSHPYSHVVFFDPHDEYDNAFPNKRGSYKVNKIDSVDLHTPYWLLNFDEFQSVFLGEVDLYKNSNGIRILKETIVSLKEREQEKIKATVGEIAKVNINAPLYFSFADELLPTLIRLNKRTIWSSDNEPAIDLSTGDFLPSSGNTNIPRDGKMDKVHQDKNYYGELDQVIEKLQSIYSDRRYQFLFPNNFDVSTSFYRFMESLLSVPSGGKTTQLTIFDLSTLPSEVMPIIIGVISRICFEYKLWDPSPKKLPLYLVFEEAHNYIPKESNSITRLPKKYLGRIAKEGRKYGINQLIISQRPSDLCETIVSQCSNFFVLRVTNPNDQAFINQVLPDHLNTLSSMIPFFQNGECLVAGECVTIPTKVIITPPSPEPNSSDVGFSSIWKRRLNNYNVRDTIHRWWDVE